MRLVSADEEHMRQACYGSRGDREWRRGGKKELSEKEDKLAAATADHRAGRLTGVAQDPRGHPAPRGPPGRLFR